MRHSRCLRHIFTCLSACLSAGAILSGPSFSRAQDRGPSRMMPDGYRPENRPSSTEEEYLSPAVKEVKEDLSIRDLASRDKNLSEGIKKLRGVLELRQALMLHEWRDNDSDQMLADIDGENRGKVEQRLVGALREALKSGAPSRQLATAGFLGEIGVSLRETVWDFQPPRRNLAAALAPDLVDLLQGKNAMVSAAAARALGKIYPEPKLAVPSLKRVLESGQVSQQLAAAEAFTALIRVADQLYATERSRSDFKEPLRRREVSDLGESVVQATNRGLQNPNPEVRRKCAETLQQAAVLLGELAASLSATDEELKEVTVPEEEQGDLLPLAKSLADQGDFLARLLRDPEAEIRLTTAHALEEMGNARMRFRRERKEGKDSLVEKALFRGLSAALPALSQSLSDPEPEVRLAAVEVLETLDSDAAAAAGALTKALADPNVFVRWAAARALSNIDPKDAEMAVAPLARVLFDPDFHARMAAAATLEKYGPPAKAAVPEMARAVDVGDAEIRVAVIRALEAVDPRDPREAQPAIPALSKALAHPDVRVRRAAAEALSRFGPLARAAEPALRRALDDREDLVRKAAAEALINLNLKE